MAPGYLTAQSRTSVDQATGFVIANSRVTSSIPAGASTTDPRGTVLGRPWRLYSRVVYLNTELSADVDPAGWRLWNNRNDENKAYYAEYRSSGPGARVSDRVAWSHQLTPAQAAQFEPKIFLAGQDHWDAPAEAERLP